MKTFSSRRRQGGIALLEAMLAVLILGIGLLGTVGLQARAYSALSDASMRAEATMAAEKLLGTMSADAPNLMAYSLAAGDTPSQMLKPWVEETQHYIPGAVMSVNLTPLTRRVQVDIVISWQRTARSPANRHAVTSYVAI
jgi:type IV pilus assembly protein PilV